MIGIARRFAKYATLRFVHRRNETWQVANGRDQPLPTALWGLTVNESGRLMGEGCDFRELADRYGTPLHVVSLAQLRRNYDGFLAAFQRECPQVEIGYSYKTNPVPGVLRALHDFGACAEVISHYELWLALQLGVAPERIIFNGPAKTDEALELAVSRSVRLINIDSLPEIDRIATTAARHGRRQAVAVRLITSVGWASQFGIALRDGSAMAAFEKIVGTAQLDPQGLHIHLGTGIRNVATYEQAISEVLEFAGKLRQRFGIDLAYLDFGGGFGVSTVQAYGGWDNRLMANGYPARAIDIANCPPIERYATMVGRQIRQYRDRNPGANPRLIFEPGRAITSSAQSLLISVLNIKPGKNGTMYAISNGGKNLAMPLGYEQHELFPADRMFDPPSGSRYNIAGPLCYPEDILFRARQLPDLRPGDLIAIMDAGAYFISNQQNFSNPRPAVVLLDDGSSRLIRAREAFEDMVRLDHSPVPVPST